jgi:microcompartment protein CcmL/EutN
MQIYAGLVVINSNPMKFAMLRHVNACVDALLALVERRQLASNCVVAQKFEELERLILRASQSTEECLQLSKDIAAAGKELERLQAELADNQKVDVFLEDYRCTLLLAHDAAHRVSESTRLLSDRRVCGWALVYNLE